MNIVTYAAQNMKPFQDQAFHSVDSLILSCVVYMHFPRANPALCDWDGVPLPALFHAEDFDTIFEHVYDAPASKELLTALVASPRFREIRVKGYVQQSDRSEEKQFAAMTFDLPDGSSYIAFRGTDATIVGWKEDFNMAFQYPVPSQAEAADYLSEAARHCRGKLYVGGHSKGGNLAVYSAVNCGAAIQDRILAVYNNDGPGFRKTLLSREEHRRIAARIFTILPKSSVVGLLMEHEESFTVVDSTQVGILQHDGFSWCVLGPRFVRMDDLTGIETNDRSIREWVDSLDQPQRPQFTDALFEVLSASGATTLAELREQGVKSAAAMLKAMAGLDKETRKALDCAVDVLFIKSGAQSLLDDWKRESAKRRRKKAQRKEKEEP